MSEHSYDPQTNLALPDLVSPTRAQVVDGRAVSFVWEAVPSATAYRLEVARSAAFEQIEVSLDDAESGMTLDGVFPTDASLFYWRVLAMIGGQWAGADVIESFTAASASQVQAVHGDDEGGRGETIPFVTTEDPEHHDHHLELTAVEDEGIRASSIFITVGVISALVLVAIVTIFQIATREIVAMQYAQTEVSGYPELRAARAESARLLSQYQVTDAAELGTESEPTYRIPVDVAMRLMATETRERYADSTVSTADLTDELRLLPRRRSR